MYEYTFDLIVFFSSTKNVKPLNESLNLLVLTVGRNELKLLSFKIPLDIFKERGVKKVEKLK